MSETTKGGLSLSAVDVVHSVAKAMALDLPPEQMAAALQISPELVQRIRETLAAIAVERPFAPTSHRDGSLPAGEGEAAGEA
jgi:hypothetical protein